MKIVVTLEVEVDPEDWYAAIGQDKAPAAVRADVKDYVYHWAHQLPAIESSGAKVVLR